MESRLRAEERVHEECERNVVDLAQMHHPAVKASPSQSAAAATGEGGHQKGETLLFRTCFTGSERQSTSGHTKVSQL